MTTRYLPNEPGVGGDLTLQEWAWSNGKAGAGTTVETPVSRQNGGCEYGEFVWLRRLGVATAAGALVELPLPPLTRDFVTGQFTSGLVYGRDLYLTTLNRTIVGVANARVTSVPNEQDFGAGTQTEGLAIFEVGGTATLYCGEFTKIRAFAGAGWTDGEAGTGRGWLATPYWTLGSQLATGGASGDAGSSATRLVGTDPFGTGFYHVEGDPKLAANWSSLERVGTGGSVFPIQKMVANNRNVWFGTGRGVLGVDGLGYSPNLTQWMELSASIANCAAIEYWNGLIWAATESGLMTFAPDGSRIDLGQYVQFGARAGAGPIFGRPLALAPCPDGLYVGYYNALTQTSYIGCLVIDPDGSYRWSMAEAVLAGQIVTFLQQVIDDTGAPGLWIGTVDVATRKLRLWRQYLPKYGDPIADALNEGPFRAATDWSVRLSRWDDGRAVPKILRRFSGLFNYMGTDYPDNTVDVQLSVDGAAFTSQGSAPSGSAAGPVVRWTGTPRTSFVRATGVQVKLVAHNATTQPLTIDTFGVRYTPNPELTEATTYHVLFGEGVTGSDPGVDLARLKHAPRDGVITITDPLGQTVEALVEPTLETSLEREAPGKGFVGRATLTTTTARTVTRWDAGFTFDSGAPYA